jgi:DHA2 family methylenomycin A resistance protein-like MFS transporter
MTRSRSIVALVAVASGFVLAMFGVTIVNTAMSDMRNQLHASLFPVVWAVDAYMLTFGAFLFVSGAVIRRIGARNAYLSGFAWFIVASAACGLAPSVGWLVAARLMQGVGAALLVPAAMSLLAESFPVGGVRTRVPGAWVIIIGVAAGISPLMGGVLVGAWGWRSIFYLNVPVGIAGWLLAWYGLSSSVAATIHRQRVIPRGSVFWNNGLVGFIAGMVIFGDLFLLSLYLQAAPDATPLRNGVEMFPLMAVIPAMDFVSSRLSVRLGHGHVLLAGLSVAFAGCLAMACMGPMDSFWRIAIPAICCNAGLGLAIPAMVSGATRAATPAEADVRSTAWNAFRQVGAFVGVALVGMLLYGSEPWDLRLRHGFLLFATCLAIALVSTRFLQRLRVPRAHDASLTSARFQRGNCS